MAKIQTNWFKVQTGDIISFRYKSGTTNKTLMHTVLVLSSKYPRITKKGKKYFLSGLKLEESNRPTVRNTSKITDLLLDYGEIVVFDAKNKIFRLKFAKKVNRRLIEAMYNKLKSRIKRLNIYRTYDWDKVRVKPVFMESIKISDELSDMLLEQYE